MTRTKTRTARVVFLICLLSILAGRARATSQVQQASNADISGKTYLSTSATFSSPTTAGNAIIVGVTFGDTNPTISATDTQGDNFVLAITTYDSRHNQGAAILYALNITGGASTTVTVQYGTSVAYLAMGVHEYQGVGALDARAGNIGTGSSLTSGSVTTTANGDLVFSCGVEDAVGDGDTFTSGAGLVKRVDLGNSAAYADEDLVQSSAGRTAATWTLSPASAWIADMAAFKPAGVGPAQGVAPSISSLSPTSGVPGTSVTITGANFGSTQGSSTVSFNGTAATPTSWSGASIVAPVPSGATTGNVIVVAGGQSSNGVSFTVTTAAPSISSLSPTSGVPGTSVTITGANFGSTQGSSTVSFSGTAATPTSWSGTSIVAQVPSGATTGNVIVVAGGQSSNGVSFTVTTAAPSISSLSPTSGVPGTSVTIIGGNFGSTQGSSTVSFNGTAAKPASWSGTSIVAQVPSGATTGNVVVTVANQASNGVNFTVETAGGSGIPTLVQHVSESNTQGNAVSAYSIRLPNLTQGGNCVIVGLNYSSSGEIPTVTDDQADTFTQVISNDDGNQTVSLFVALNVAGGAQNISVHLGSATAYVAAVASEFYNVATANAVDGSHGHSGSGTSITAGSFTPTTSGDLIYQLAVQDSTSNPMISFTQGSSPWTLLSADLMDSMTSQYQVQTTASAINPSMSMSPANSWNSVGIALKSGSSGSDISGMHIVHLQHNAFPAYASSPAYLQFPTTGNLIVVSWIGVPGHDLTNITDNQGNSYVQIGSPFGNADSGDSQLFYVANANSNTMMTGPVLTASGTDYSGSTALFFDIAGASTSPFDSTAGWQKASGEQTGSGNVTAVSIAPSTPGGLVISSIGVASNTLTGVAPGNFLSSVTNPEVSPWPNDENNGWAVNYGSGPISFVWNSMGGPVYHWASVAAAFKSSGH